MQFTRIGTRYIVLVWALLIVLLGTVLLIGYRRNMADLHQLMTNEANQLSDIVTISARASIHSLDEVEDLTARRLLNNARLIEQIVAMHPIEAVHLETIIAENSLHMVNILDAAGVSEYRAGDSTKVAGNKGTHHEAVERVLTGESEEDIIGFMADTYSSDTLYGVVVRRRDGGAIVVNAGSDEMLAFRRSVGLGTLLADIGARDGIQYIVLQDQEGIVAASQGVHEMNRIDSDPFLIQAQRGISGTRLFDGAGVRVFEIARLLTVDNIPLGILRIGLAITSFEAIRIRAIRQFVILFIAAAISGALLFIFLMLRQNYRILHIEHDRILMDVRRMEEESRRSERLLSMGRLGGGVAHEIRNPLNAISIITQRLKAEFTPATGVEEYRSFLSTISTEIDRITHIVENFLAYVRPPKLTLEDVSLLTLVTEAASVVQEQARSAGIVLYTSIEDGLRCRCDQDQMKQVLLNLLINAIDAIGGEGSIRIRAEQRNSRIALSIADTGPGIPDEIRTNMFDPYFTTKDHGSGLGLSEVHRIISAHGGSVDAASGLTGGAIITILLPVTGEKR